MIFVTVGSQKFQFNRLLISIDKLIEQNKITEEVFAQIGYSDYKPKNFKFKEFMDREEFNEIMQKADKVITHGGTGAIVGAIKKGKKVIVIPRLAEFCEHVDNHQLQIAEEFTKQHFIIAISEIGELQNAIEQLNTYEFRMYKSSTENILKSIEGFIESL